MDCLVQSIGERFDGNPLEGFYQRVGKTVQAVSVAHDALAFDVIENFADFCGRSFAMVEKGDEIGDGALEINIVFPKRVVSVDKERV